MTTLNTSALLVSLLEHAPLDVPLRTLPAVGGRHWGGRFGSQLRQAEWVDAALQHRGGRELFVVEAGGYDGLSYSNSFFLEVMRHWSCLLVEGNPMLQAKIRTTGRSCDLFNGGLSPNGRYDSFAYLLAGGLGGIVTEFDDNARKRAADGVRNRRIDVMANGAGNGSTVLVHCFPLHELARQLGRTTIDYLSLDTEGSEGAILEGTDFTAVEVGLITVEHNNQPVHSLLIHALNPSLRQTRSASSHHR